MIRPKALRVEADTIPSELKLINAWVVWRYESKDGKWTKPPYRVRGQGRASSTDPATWSNFADGVKRYERGGVDGVGFVLHEGHGIVGVDLDHCLNNQKLEPWESSRL